MTFIDQVFQGFGDETKLWVRGSNTTLHIARFYFSDIGFIAVQEEKVTFLALKVKLNLTVRHLRES